ncbi:MAG: hypothetical protein IBJ09_03390 [Bacteroidia bacterium]|nr:hypothetical protein [Bacteroidia bacterium]
MKRVLVILGFLSSGFAFSQAMEANAEIDKTMRPAVQITIKNNPKTTQEALDSKLKAEGLKGSKNVKGWSLYEGALFSKISDTKMDYYFKVEQNGKIKEESLVYISMSKGYGNFVDGNADRDLIEKAKGFLNSFVADVSAHQLTLDIAAQTKIAEEAVKAHDKSVKDGEDLAKKLEENKQDQANKKAEMEKQRAALEALKARK